MLRLPKCELIRLDLDNSGYNIIHRFDKFLASKLYEHASPVTHQSNSKRVRYSRRINRSERIFIVGGSNSFCRGPRSQVATAHAQILEREARIMIDQLQKNLFWIENGHISTLIFFFFLNGQISSCKMRINNQSRYCRENVYWSDAALENRFGDIPADRSSDYNFYP